jgi:Family of unknown function (DUF5681)
VKSVTTAKRKRRGNPKMGELGIATRFKPGQSGNPTGRPKNYALSEVLAALGEEIEAKSGKTIAQLGCEALLQKVLRGDVQAFREFADRIEGKPRQKVELSGPEGGAIPIGTTEELDARIAELLDRGAARRAGQPAS